MKKEEFDRLTELEIISKTKELDHRIEVQGMMAKWLVWPSSFYKAFISAAFSCPKVF